MTVQAPGMASMAASGAPPPREAVEAFLNNGLKMMRSDETRQLLKSAEAVPKPGLKLIDLQRAEWDPLGFDRDVGCKTLDRLEVSFPGDTDIVALRNEFIISAQRTFVQALEDRRPETLQRDGQLRRETIMEFFDACNTKMDLPETKEALAKHLQETTEVPNKLIIQWQREMLEVLGIEKEHGCQMLSKIGRDFPDDKQLHARFEGWRMKAQTTCMSVVRAYQEGGGNLPENFFALSKEMSEKEAEVRKELDVLPEKQKQELLEKYQKKVEVFMKLPLERRMDYMKKMSDDERPDFLKAQMLLVGIMQKQWKDGAARAAAPSAGSGAPAMPPAMPGIAVASPQQQQMM